MSFFPRIESLQQKVLQLFFFILPWPSIWMYREVYVDGIKWQYATLGFYASEVVLWLFFLLFFTGFIKKFFSLPREERRFSFSFDRIFLSTLFLFVVYVLMSRWWAVDSAIAAQHGLHLLEGVLLFVTLSISPYSFRQLASWFLVGMIAPMLLAIYQFFSQTTVSSTLLGLAAHPAFEAGTSVVVDAGSRWLRAYGSFAHPNMFGGFVVLSFFMSSYLLLQQPKQLSGIQKFFPLGMLIFSIVALIISWSRSSWIAGALTGVLLLGFFFKTSVFRWQYVFVCVSIPILFFLLLPNLFLTRLTVGSLHELRSMSERVDGYTNAMTLFQSSPWFGVGIGNYTQQEALSFRGFPVWVYQPVHNMFLLALVELGIVGFGIASISFVGYVTYIASRVHKRGLLLFLFCISPLVPLAVLDHYIVSSYQGLLLAALWLALVTHSLSTQEKNEEYLGLK
ncbi:MAG: O-antigen ligase family protein [Candidatus Magasanikbacteria bacterium]|nr:O-antigen ligase family protein [Candidatus Magasanikbacteria bacterium]